MKKTASETPVDAELSENAASEVCQALRGRADFYRLLAELFAAPLTQNQVDALAAYDLNAWTGVNDSMDAGINDITRYLRKRNSGTREELAVDYTGAFGGTKTVDGNNAVPFESVFTSADGLLCQESYHAVHDMFRKAALKKRAGDNTPDDHLSYLCEFMFALSARAAEKAAAGDCTGAAAEVHRTRLCLREHILNWYDAFSNRALQLVETRFYRGVLRLAGGYFAFDNETVDDLIAALEA